MLLLGSILSLGFIATSMVGYFVARDSLTQQISTDTLPLIGDNIYSEIQRDLLKPILISSLMANDTFLKDWITAGEESPTKIRKYLENIKSSYDTVTSFFISDKTLNYYHPSGILKTIDNNSAVDRWYFQAKEMSVSHQLNVDFDASADNSLTVFINYKVIDDKGDFLGITGVGLSLSKVQAIIEDYQQRYDSEIFFIDLKGDVTLRGPASNKTLNLEQIVDGSSIKQRILSQKSASFSYRKDLHKIMLDSRYVEELRWYLIIKRSDQNLNNSLFDSLLINLLISLLITVAVLVISWFTLGSYQKRLEIMATTDKLTGLNNRQMFDPIFEQLFNYATRNNTDLAAVIIDIDNFKKVNDQYGHPFGDKVLIEVARLMQLSSRKSDVLCRWGGEEFVILMPNCNSVEALVFTQQLQKKFAEHCFDIEQHSIKIQLSMGLSHKTAADQPSKLIFRADQALLSAKKSGKNRIVIG